MKTSQVNQTFVGKRVKGIFTGLEVTGTIIGIVEDHDPFSQGKPLCSKGVRIRLDEPVQWGEDLYKEYESTSRVHDDWGNLEYTELI